LAFLFGTVFLTACGGGGSRVNPLPTPATSVVSKIRANATLRIVVPSTKQTAGASSSTRKPAYVSPATQSIAISFTPSAGGSTQTDNEDLTPASNPDCSASLVSPEVCTVSLSLTPGSYIASFATYDGLLNASGNPTGNVLSQNQDVAVTIVAGQSNNINVTLQGVPVSVGLIPSASSTLNRTGANAYTLSKYGDRGCLADERRLHGDRHRRPERSNEHAPDVHGHVHLDQRRRYR